MLKLLFAFFLLLSGSEPLLSAANTSQVKATNYATTSVTTAAYVTLISSTSTSTRDLEICDYSTKIIKFAIGAAGSEIDIASNAVSGCIVIPYYIPAGSRISAEAVDASATSGYNILSLIP